MTTPDRTITGAACHVHRVDANGRAAAFPTGRVVDVWVFPAGMHMAVMQGGMLDEVGHRAFFLVLAYVQEDMRTLCRRYGLPESLCVDVWHLQYLEDVENAPQAREVTRELARAVADGNLPYEPIAPEQRGVWQTVVSSFAQILTGRRPV